MWRAALVAAALAAIPAAAQSQQQAISKMAFGCQDWDLYKRLVLIRAQGDKEAFKNALSHAIWTGACTIFHVGDTVFIAESSMFSVKLRRKGETSEYWIERRELFMPDSSAH